MADKTQELDVPANPFGNAFTYAPVVGEPNYPLIEKDDILGQAWMFKDMQEFKTSIGLSYSVDIMLVDGTLRTFYSSATSPLGGQLIEAREAALVATRKHEFVAYIKKVRSKTGSNSYFTMYDPSQE